MGIDMQTDTVLRPARRRTVDHIARIAILLTGGFAYDKMLMGWIEEYVGFLAPVHVYPGEDEMLALAQGAMRVLTGKEEAKVY